MTERAIPEGEFTMLPTVILRLGAESMEVVTVDDGGHKALVVFRNPEDAAAFQERAGRHTAGEGFERSGMTHEAIAAVLEKHGLGWVHLPAPAGSAEKGSLFRGARFVRFLAECRRA